MFARQAFRVAHMPVRAEFRRYASTEPSRSSNSTLRYGIGAFLVLIPITAYFYPPQRAPPAAKKGVKGRAEGNQEAKEEPVGGEKAAPQKTFLGDNQWVSLKLEYVEQVSPNAKKFRFALPSEDHVSGLKIASALLTKYKGPTDEKPVMRPYTPVSDEDQKGYLELVVKKYEKGPMSTHIHDMAVDQRLDFKGPLPKYPWEANKHDHIALIAGGTGITPMFQLTRAIFNNPEDKTKVTLVFGNVSESDILLKPELSKLENEYPNRFTAFYVLDNPPKEWAGGKGFITKELLEKVLPDKNGNVKVFVCGPPGMYKAISGTKPSPQDQGELTGILKDLGWDKDKVYKF